jgi:hypothetical protein
LLPFSSCRKWLFLILVLVLVFFQHVPIFAMPELDKCSDADKKTGCENLGYFFRYLDMNGGRTTRDFMDHMEPILRSHLYKDRFCPYVFADPPRNKIRRQIDKRGKTKWTKSKTEEDVEGGSEGEEGEGSDFGEENTLYNKQIAGEGSTLYYDVVGEGDYDRYLRRLVEIVKVITDHNKAVFARGQAANRKKKNSVPEENYGVRYYANLTKKKDAKQQKGDVLKNRYCPVTLMVCTMC